MVIVIHYGEGSEDAVVLGENGSKLVWIVNTMAVLKYYAFKRHSVLVRKGPSGRAQKIRPKISSQISSQISFQNPSQNPSQSPSFRVRCCDLCRDFGSRRASLEKEPRPWLSWALPQWFCNRASKLGDAELVVRCLCQIFCGILFQEVLQCCMVKTFRRVQPDLPLSTRPPPNPSPWTWFGSDFDPIQTRKPPFQFRIRLKSGQNQVWIRSREGSEGGRVQKGRSGLEGSAAPPESLDCMVSVVRVLAVKFVCPKNLKQPNERKKVLRSRSPG